MKITVFLSGLICLFSFNSFAVKGESNCQKFRQAVAVGSASQKLKKLLDVQWKYIMATYPRWATYVGYPGYDDRWEDLSLESIERMRIEDQCLLEAFKKISRKGLTGQDLVTYEVVLDRQQKSVESNKFRGEYLILDQLSGLHMDVIDVVDVMSKNSKKDYENILSRLEKVPLLEEQTETLLRSGLKTKITPVKMFLEKVPDQFTFILKEKPEDSPLYSPFKNMKEIEGKEEIQKRALEIVTNKVYPSFKKLRDFLVKEYIPAAREEIAFTSLPEGKAWYAFKVKNSTTTMQTAEEIHQIGLKEVERITEEMQKIKEQVQFKGDLKAFNKFLLTDSQFFYKDKEEMLADYRNIAKKIDPELVKIFKTLPRLPYGVREMPDYKAKDAPGAYYEGGTLEAGRAGYFTANVYDLKRRPKWDMEDLTAHEAVPGHHLQISIAQELTDLPMIRRQDSHMAFVEGWALYAETIGEEVGLFKDPYSKYGQLNGEMWRAIRLVVDTGMHALGWSRQKAIDFFADHTAMNLKEIEVEVNRYVTWPGQALAYKTGQLKFKELRERAKQELGDKFDIREFHDQCLKNGSLPLNVLDKLMNEWIAKVKKSGGKENKKKTA